jgi:hypothetical protein
MFTILTVLLHHILTQAVQYLARLRYSVDLCVARLASRALRSLSLPGCSGIKSKSYGCKQSVGRCISGGNFLLHVRTSDDRSWIDCLPTSSTSERESVSRDFLTPLSPDRVRKSYTRAVACITHGQHAWDCCVRFVERKDRCT